MVGDLDFLTLGARFLELVSLGCDRPKFFVEVAYPREDRDFVLILFFFIQCVDSFRVWKYTYVYFKTHNL